MHNFPSMRQLAILYKPPIATVRTARNTSVSKRVGASRGLQHLDIQTIVLLLLPLLALFLWSISLQKIALNAMNNLGLISALSPRIIVALAILVLSFTLSLQRRKVVVPLLAFQLACIMLIVYATPHLIEEAPRFTPVYRHAGYTDYIMQTGTVDPYLDIYFNWPGFFVLSAFFTKAFGFSTILSFAGWAPLFYNLLYAGPMYVIFTSITTHKRLVWLSLLFFQLTNWVGQDYFSPQGLNFFLYLVIIMILLKWFRVPPRVQRELKGKATPVHTLLLWLKAPDPASPAIGPWQRRGLLGCIVLAYALIVFSHPLTPFFTLLSVFSLVMFRRCAPFWLPILMTLMTAAWIFIVARPYLATHANGIIGSLGDLADHLPKSIATGHMKEYLLYAIIAKLRLYMTLALWLLALLGGIKRLRQGHKDITLILLATVGFTLIVAQSYGGEILMRIYLFTEPFMCFFAAALFFANPMPTDRVSIHTRLAAPFRTAILIAVNLILLAGLLFTRYGDEHVDYISNAEWNAVQSLYRIAPTHAFIIEAWNDAPVFFKDYAKYKIHALTYSLPEAVIHTNAAAVVQLFADENNPNSYIIFSQEEQIDANAWSELPPDALARLEAGLLQTGKFKIVYSNSDTQILQFVR